MAQEDYHPTSVRLTTEEAESLDEIKGLMDRWIAGTKLNRSTVLKMAMNRGLEVLRREVLIDPPHLTARLRRAVELGVEIPVMTPGLKVLQERVGAHGTPFAPSGFFRKLTLRNNEDLVEAFREDLKKGGPEASELLIEEPLVSWPVGAAHYYEGERRPEVKDLLLSSERWQRIGWGRARFYAAGGWTIGLLSFVDLNQFPGVGIVNDVEGIVGYLTACFKLDWTKIVWVDHRPVSIFKEWNAGGGQEFNVVKLAGEPQAATVPALMNPEWLRLPEPIVSKLLGVKE